MWVITVYLQDKNTMFEFQTENEAREAFKNINGCKILTEVINYHCPSNALVAMQKDLHAKYIIILISFNRKVAKGLIYTG